MYDKIKVVVMDVDGTLTDGVYQISSPVNITKSVVIKSFYTRDFYAIEQLMRKGIRVLILTQSHDSVIKAQIQRICGHSAFWRDNETGSYGKFPEGSVVREKLSSLIKEKMLCVSSAIDDKKEFVEFYLESADLCWDNVAYIGDAENDLECIKKARLSGCPSDAIEEVKENALYPSNYNGGRGAVHDFCMHLLEKRKTNES